VRHREATVSACRDLVRAFRPVVAYFALYGIWVSAVTYVGARLGLWDDYQINVFYSQDDGGYIADIPDLDACSAFGASPQAALEEVLQAKDAWLVAARERGIAIPSAWYRPALYA
jgi:predicted RNase H-like HicB family nuclease